MTKREQKVFDDMRNGINAAIVKGVTAGEALDPQTMAKAQVLNELSELLADAIAKPDTEETQEGEA